MTEQVVLEEPEEQAEAAIRKAEEMKPHNTVEAKCIKVM